MSNKGAYGFPSRLDDPEGNYGELNAKSGAVFRKNMLVNGGFDVWDYGTSFTSATTPANSDATYLVTKWCILSDGNDIVDVTRTTTTPEGALYGIAFDVETAAKKFGLINILEYADAFRFIGGVASLSFKAKMSSTATFKNISAAILSWTSTADSPTLDVISSWGNAGVTPTLAANWSIEKMKTFALTGTYQTFKLENVAIDTASTTNIAVLIWSNDLAGTIGDFIYLTEVQLEDGEKATAFERLPVSYTASLCEYYYKYVRLGWAWYNADSPITCRIMAPFGKMRSIPTTTITTVTTLNLATPSVISVGTSYVQVAADSTAVDVCHGRYGVTLSAELGV